MQNNLEVRAKKKNWATHSYQLCCRLLLRKYCVSVRTKYAVCVCVCVCKVVVPVFCSRETAQRCIITHCDVHWTREALATGSSLKAVRSLIDRP